MAIRSQKALTLCAKAEGLRAILAGVSNCHAVGAMLKWYRREKNYTLEGIDGSSKKLQSGQSKADLRVPALHYFSWKYIQSETLGELRANRVTLIALLRAGDRHYINNH